MAGGAGHSGSITHQLGPETPNQQLGYNLQKQGATNLQTLLNGHQFQDAYQPLIHGLQSYINQGGMPNSTQIGQANNYAAQVFAPQQAALNNTFHQASIDTARQAAILGRPVNDPILQAKLAQYEGQQQSVLSGQQGAFAAQFAQQLPQQMLGLQSQLAGINAGLASQAIQNQQALFNVGNQIVQQGLNTQMATMGTTMNQPGSLGGAISGAIGGMGAGPNMFSSLSKSGLFSGIGSLFSGGGSSAGIPTRPNSGGMYARPLQ